ncbi:MAG: endopeptidase La [Oscillospiraceae bacterium]|nr:endopeptidase La [Oscillospiraceae bacterium]
MKVSYGISMPVMALRGISVFPQMVYSFDVGREKSIRALDEAMNGDQNMILLMQKDVSVDDPGPDDLFEIGVVVHIRQILKMPGDVVRILVEGLSRIRMTEFTQESPSLEGVCEKLDDEKYRTTAPKVEALLRVAYQLYGSYCDLLPKGNADALLRLMTSDDPAFVSDFLGQNCGFRFDDKQRCLEILHPVKRLETALKILSSEIEIMKIENDIADKVQEAMNKNQRDYYLREQLKVIHQELGEEDEDQEIDDYRQKILALHLEQDTEERLLKELSRLEKQPLGSSEAAVMRNYLDTVLELPWNEETKDTVNIEAARRMLDEDHYGLDTVKKRVLELLAVRKLAPDISGQIICLVGPPGVGKTSIATSIARCLGRKMARISLGGVHDEAEIRGHRKTYIGSMPGRIIAGMKSAGSKNPVLLLDEIDKLGNDYRGDPASALLEVLDGEQNKTFRDNYLEVPFDLSRVLFITTANTTSTIPAALLDRMEVIELSSYTDEEKVMIAKHHLLPKEMEKVGLKKGQLTVYDNAWREIIDGYTRESGVRHLQREIATICRKAALKFAESEDAKRVTITASRVEEYLGVRKYLKDTMPERDQVGLVTGLAWTSVGGVTLEVEVNVVEGTGKLVMTGSLGDVMKESVSAAMSYIRSRAACYHIPADFYKTKDIHVHFPEGAVPKDGPSAGITICTALVSALTGAPVRRDIAMTGEISIRGRVMAIGGLKEKTMAALRHGLKTVIIPEDNVKDLEEIDQTVRSRLNFIPVKDADTVISTALDFSKAPKTENRMELAAPEQKSQAAALRQ